MDADTSRETTDRTAALHVRISDPGDVAAALPRLLGFRPVESVVLVSLTGPSGRRVGVTARADIPDPSAVLGFAQSMVQTVARHRPRAVLVAVVSDAPDTGSDVSGPDLPHRLLVGALVLALTAAGLAVPETLLVGRGRWWSYECPERCCAPGAGTPLPERVSDLEVAAVASGQVLAPDRQALVERIAPASGPSGAMAAEALVVGEECARQVLAHGSLAVAEESWRALTAVLERLRPGAVGGLSDAEVARVAWGLRDAGVRDRALGLALGSDAVAAERLWTECTRRVPAPLDAAPATLLAVCAWLRGDGATANVALDRARGSDPGYSLARLLTGALDAGLPPKALEEMITRTLADHAAPDAC